MIQPMMQAPAARAVLLKFKATFTATVAATIIQIDATSGSNPYELSRRIQVIMAKSAQYKNQGHKCGECGKYDALKSKFKSC